MAKNKRITGNDNTQTTKKKRNPKKKENDGRRNKKHGISFAHCPDLTAIVSLSDLIKILASSFSLIMILFVVIGIPLCTEGKGMPILFFLLFFLECCFSVLFVANKRFSLGR